VAGFWYGDVTYELPSGATAKLGGPLLPHEITRIQRVSRAEIERAFAGLPIAFTERHDELWRVQVRQMTGARGPLAVMGEAMPLGPLGGYGDVSFLNIALSALQYAPANASRQTIIDGIGRGIGRVTVHEFAYEIQGHGVEHNKTDRDSYEFESLNRQSQYYGELHWTIAWPLLQRALGK
jgi:hypothetical protein